MHIPPPVFGLAGVITLVAANWLWPSFSIDFNGQWIVCGLLALAGLAVAVSAARGFFRAETTVLPNKPEQASALVTDGVYRFTRNPMYLGLALIVTGVGIGLGTLATPFILAAFIWIINTRQIVPEEHALEKNFDAEFIAYKARVRRWL